MRLKSSSEMLSLQSDASGLLVGQANAKTGHAFGILMACFGALRTFGAPAPLTLFVESNRMFLILLSYTKPLENVDRLLGAHRNFLEQHYANGNFLLSGRKEPRTGGVILAKAETKNEIEGILKEDPFYREEVAEYSIIEFVPTMAAKDLAHLKQAL